MQRFGSLLVRIEQLRRVRKTILQEAGVGAGSKKGARRGAGGESTSQLPEAEDRVELLFLAPATAILDAELGSLTAEAADIKAEHGLEDSLEEEEEMEEEGDDQSQGHVAGAGEGDGDGGGADAEGGGEVVARGGGEKHPEGGAGGDGVLGEGVEEESPPCAPAEDVGPPPEV